MPYQPFAGSGLDVPTKDKQYHYRWLDYMNKDNLKQHLRAHGEFPPYKILQGSTVADTKKLCLEHGLPEEYVSSTRNWIEYGYCVLARLPRAEYDRRVAEIRQHEQQQQASATEAYLQSAEGVKGVKPVIRELEEHEDRKDFELKSHKSFVSLSRASAK